MTTGFTLTPGVTLVANVGPVTLNDGDFYLFIIPRSQALPPGFLGTEEFQIMPTGGAAITVGDCRARVLRSERLFRCERLCMVFTQDSICTAPGPTTASPAFIVREGLPPIP